MEISELQIDQNTLCWLAGLLEGEGYFFVVNSIVSGKRYRYPLVGVQMTDKDVIERVGLIFNTKVFTYEQHNPKRYKKKPKTMHRATLSGTKAASLMAKLRPLMGERRKARIDEILTEWKSIPSTQERRRSSCAIKAKARHRNAKGEFVTTTSATCKEPLFPL